MLRPGYREPIVIDNKSSLPSDWWDTGRIVYNTSDNYLYYHGTQNNWYKLATSKDTRKPALPVYRVAASTSFNADYYGGSGLQNAINDAYNNYGGGIISIMPGTYHTTDTLTMKPNIILIGNGRGTTTLNYHGFELADDIEFRFLELTGNTGGTVKTLLHAKNDVKNILVDDCHLTGDTGVGIAIADNGKTITNLIIRNSVIDNLDRSYNIITDAAPVRLYNNLFNVPIYPRSPGIYIVGNTINSSKDDGIYSNEGGTWFVSDNVIDVNSGSGYGIYCTGTVYLMNNTVKNVSVGVGTWGSNYVFNNYISGVDYGFRSEGNGNLIMSGNIINANSYGIEFNKNGSVEITSNLINGGDYGISVSVPGSIVGNRVVGVNYNAIIVSGNATVSGNTIQNSSQDSDNGYSDIYVNDKYNIITGNNILENATNKSSYGIEEDDNADYNVITSNIVNGSHSGIKVVGSHTVTVGNLVV